jgi:hypothetical protein
MARGKAPWWLIYIPAWTLAVGFLAAFFWRSKWPPSPPAGMFEGTFLFLGVALLLIPFATRINLFNMLEFEQELKDAKEDLKTAKSDIRQLSMAVVSARASAAVTNNNYFGEASAPRDSGPTGEGAKTRHAQVSAGGYVALPTGPLSKLVPSDIKVLNTLWRYQAKKFPTLDTSFLFTLLPQAPDYLTFKDAVKRLATLGYVWESPEGYAALTTVGLDLCASEGQNFNSEMWGDQLDPPDATTVASIKTAVASIKAKQN